MKIALLIAGRLDTFENMYPHLKEHIIDNLNPDIFFSGHPNSKGIQYCENKIIELWKPKKYLLREYTKEIRKTVHPNDEIFNSNKNPHTTPHTWLSGMYNVKIVNDLKIKYEIKNNFQYDVVIKARTDLQWYSNISNEELVLAKKGNILIPTAWDFTCIHNMGTSDVVAITNSENMNKYSSFINHVDDYFSEGITFHPETYMGIHINRMKLKRIKISHGIDSTGWCLIDPNVNRKLF